MDGVTKAQRGQDTCLSSHSKLPFGFLFTAGVSEDEQCIWNPETYQDKLLPLLTSWLGAGRPPPTTPNPSLSFL